MHNNKVGICISYVILLKSRMLRWIGQAHRMGRREIKYDFGFEINGKLPLARWNCTFENNTEMELGRSLCQVTMSGGSSGIKP